MKTLIVFCLLVLAVSPASGDSIQLISQSRTVSVSNNNGSDSKSASDFGQFNQSVSTEPWNGYSATADQNSIITPDGVTARGRVDSGGPFEYVWYEPYSVNASSSFEVEFAVEAPQRVTLTGTILVSADWGGTNYDIPIAQISLLGLGEGTFSFFKEAQIWHGSGEYREPLDNTFYLNAGHYRLCVVATTHGWYARYSEEEPGIGSGGLALYDIVLIAEPITTLYVPSQYATIQAAVNSSKNGDVVIVAPGHYYENIIITDKNITLTGTEPNNPNVVAATIIDGNGINSVLEITNSNVAIYGLTITGGYAENGGGIYGSDGKIVLEKCCIRENQTVRGDYSDDGGDGGGIYGVNSIIEVSGSIISHNRTASGRWDGIGGNGGGVCLINSSSHLSGCKINFNYTGDGMWNDEGQIGGGFGGDGGGIYVSSGSDLFIHDCIIVGNRTGCGGGNSADMVYCEECPGGWWADGFGGSGGSGGGIGIATYGDPAAIVTIMNSVLAENIAGAGGNLLTRDGIEGGTVGSAGSGSATTGGALINCTVYQNLNGPSGQRYYDRDNPPPVVYTYGSGTENARIINSIVYNNTVTSCEISYSDIQDGREGIGNISAVPLFADANNPDPNLRDYHLKSQYGRWDPNTQAWVYDDVTSPCIDAGDPNSDWSKEFWPHGGRINMGAYGGTPEASMSASLAGNIADLNLDDIVDWQDFVYFSQRWEAQEILLAEDMDHNGVVNNNDLAVFAENWLKTDNTLIGYWKFDDGSEATARDFSNYDNTGKLVNGPAWTTGMSGGALHVDGGNDAVEISTNNMRITRGSLSLWAYADSFSIAQNYLFGHSIGAWSNRIQLFTNVGKLGAGLGDTHSLYPNIQTLSAGQWYHLVLTWDGTHYAVYVNGVLKATGTYSGLTSFAATADIGNNGGPPGNPASRTEAWDGKIDEVRLYNRVLTARDVWHLYSGL